MRCLLLAACLLHFLISVAQRPGFVHYTTDNSALPHDIVYSVSQGRNGCLWISTDDGLARYDGSKMTVCNDHLQSHYIIDAQEADGKLWIATWKGGIHLRVNGRNMPLDERTRTMSALSVNRLMVRDNTVIAWNFAEYTAFRFDAGTRSLTAFSLRKKKGKQTVASPGQREYYRFFNVSMGLLACGDGGIYKVVNGHLKLLAAGIVPDEIREASAGKLFVRIGSEIWRSDPTFRNLEHFYSVRVPFMVRNKQLRPHILASFAVLPSGRICLGFSDGLFHQPIDFCLVDPKTGAAYDLGREVGAKAQTTGLFVDSEGGLWLSTDGDGLYHIFDRQFRHLSSASLFSYAGVTDLFQTSADSLFIGTKRGVYLYSGGKTQQFRAPWHPFVLKLFGSANGIIGVNAEQGSSRILLRNGSRQVSYTHRRAFAHQSVEYDRNYTVLHIISAHGIRKKITLPERIVDAAEDESGRLWVATLFGLYRCDAGKGVTRVRLPAHARINCLLSDGGDILIGTNKGLLRLHEGKNRSINALEALAGQNVRCLYGDRKGSLWAGTERGLFHLLAGKISVFRKRDGLIADDVSCIAPLNPKELAVGSSQGVSILPVRYRKATAGAPVFLEEIRVNGRVYAQGTPLKVPHSGSLRISYTSPTFVYPELVRFRYRLDRGARWQITGDRSLLLDHLRPGEYTLEISARKYDSPFGKPAIVRFTILSPWWASAWFVTTAAAGIIALSALLFRRQLRRQKRTLNARRELAELRIKALQAQLNPHFVSNALSTIQYYGLVNDELAFNRYFSQFSELTRLFLEVSRRGLIPLSTELELVKNYLELEQLRFGSRFAFTVGIDPDIDCGRTFLPGLLIQPLAENAIHHGLLYLPEGIRGMLTIEIRQSGGKLCITVDDNGIGRAHAAAIRNGATRSFRSRSGAILREMQEAWNMQYGCEMSILTSDKISGAGEPAGTRVTIRLVTPTKDQNKNRNTCQGHENTYY
jgi:ligand-binding sensor domain-containing protein